MPKASFLAGFARYGRLCCLLVMVVAACRRETDASLAERGVTDGHAHVRATARISIKAPPAKVWAILADIQHWPEWQHDIEETSIQQRPAAGVPFRWMTKGGRIHSRIVLFEPMRRMAWTGHLLIFHAIHVWTVEPLPDGETSVMTNESLAGWPITLLYSSQDLREADRRWLAFLKDKAEL